MAGMSGGRPSIYPTLLYADAKAAIRQLTEAFGFTELSVYEGEDGSVALAELAQGNGAVRGGGVGRDLEGNVWSFGTYAPEMAG